MVIVKPYRCRPNDRGVKTMDEKTRNDLYILALGVIIGGGIYLANSLILYTMTMNKDKSDVAEGLYLDISSLEDHLIATDREFLANPDSNYIYVQATPLYFSNGVYFSYQRDIPTMNRKIAQDTFTFYNHLLAAEGDRSLVFEIQRFGDQRELTAAELTRQQILTRDTAREVNISVSLLPNLTKELDAAA
jgi:hypothetical protein